jgi:8-oxo-dGTP pyrophosphatase MutT (NUDIX family)
MPVRAAGGVVVRRGAGHGWEIALVYRASRGDWSFPKGKLEPGETELSCARREVEEETGLLCNFGQYLDQTFYVDRRGRPKTVQYWLMYPLEGEFEPTEEVDDMQWVPLELVARVLTYEHDRTMLAEVVTPALTGRALAARA